MHNFHRKSHEIMYHPEHVCVQCVVNEKSELVRDRARNERLTTKRKPHQKLYYYVS